MEKTSFPLGKLLTNNPSLQQGINKTGKTTGKIKFELFAHQLIVILNFCFNACLH